MSVKILIIDDSDDDRYLVKRTLSQIDASYDVVEAESACEALASLEAGDGFDFIFLDYMLPDLDGIGLLKQLYDKGRDLGPCPIIVFTGQGSETVAIEAIRYGAQDYLIKGHISRNTLEIAMARSKEIFDLKMDHNEAKAFLEHSQKMDVIGKLTGGIAHDFNNLLTITYGNAELLHDLLQMPDVNAEMCLKRVEVIERATSRGADLVKRLMVFARQRTLEPVSVELNYVLCDLIGLLERTLGSYIDIKACYGQDLHMIYIDPSQFEHAVINMGINARDAMPDGGDLKLETMNVVLDAQEASLLQVEAGDYVCVCISDTGTGIADDVLPNIFEPFFTTKSEGNGTGLGLSMVYRFVKDSGGALDVKSEVGGGTSFSLYFPLSEHDVEVVEDEEVMSQDVVGGCETVLVVEDEEEIRFLTTLVLREAGYNVLEAENGHEALEVIQNSDEPIDLIFTDISMPGEMNGVQMAARAQALRPNIPLLFTSGYAADAIPDMNLARDYPILHKPFQPHDLLLKIRDIIDG